MLAGSGNGICLRLRASLGLCASPGLRAALAAAMLLIPLAGHAQQTQPPPPIQAQPPAGQAPAAQLPPPALPPVQPRFVVVIDPAHGGTDTGARLSSQMLEKDLALTLALRLRSILNAHGIAVITTRDSDALVPAVNRAETADHAVAAACISLHATASGSGIHLFTSSLAAIPMARFLPWDNAQGAYNTQSLRLSSDINSAMAGAQIPVTLGRTALQPLDNFACPAVAVEAAPLLVSGKMTPLSSQEYQNRIVTALAAGIEQWRRDWRQQP